MVGPDVRHNRLAARGPAGDAIVVAVLLAVGLGEVASQNALRPVWEWAPAAVVAAGALGLRRRSAFVALGASFAVMVFAGARSESYDALPTFPLLAMLVAMFSVGAHVPSPRSLAGPLSAFPVLAVVALLVGDLAFTDVLITPFFATGVWGAGFLLRRSRTQARAISAQVEVFQEERGQLAREAVLEERGRIARELHDAVAQSVSVMVLQMGALRQRLHDDQELERETLQRLEKTGREAVVEMRRMLGILREDDADLDNGALPGLDRVEELVDAVRAAGLPVELEQDGEPVPLSPGLDLSAYRIVQEALNNVVKHAPGAQTAVEVTYARDALVLRIVNDAVPGAPTGGNGRSPRHGLIGMHERVTLFDGELRAGPREGGGFAVEARLPIPRELR